MFKRITFTSTSVFSFVMHSKITLTRTALVAQGAIVSLTLNVRGLYVFKHIKFLLRCIFSNYTLPNAGISIINFSHLCVYLDEK